jgi:heat-inducible transcriptional repressor
MLNERSSEVLKSLIQLHIATGEPVGSESLARIFDRRVSPATLRNIMAELERAGYLDHPHTSAGRVPTDEGYRVYVDSLMSHEALPSRELAAIESALRPRDGSAQQLLQSASHLLSRMSRNVGFVVAPEIGRASFRHVDLVRLPHPRILVVMVSRSGLVTSKVIEVEEQMSQDDLQACASYLNARFSGMTLPAIRARLMEAMREEKALYDLLLKRALSVGERAFAAAGEGDVYLDGTANILEQPELVDLDRMRELFKTFEEKGRLVKILNACLADSGVRITIGHENRDHELRDLALVTTACPVDGEPLGIGVMGSTRMEYARVVALVEHIAHALSRALGDLRE